MQTDSLITDLPLENAQSKHYYIKWLSIPTPRAEGLEEDLAELGIPGICVLLRRQGGSLAPGVFQVFPWLSKESYDGVPGAGETVLGKETGRLESHFHVWRY